MAKRKTIDVAEAAASGVVVKRAWKSAEVWNHATGAVVAGLGLVAVLAPTALPFIAELELSPFWTMVIVVALNGAIHVNGWVLKLQSKSVLGDRVDVEIADESLFGPDDVEHNGH